MASYRYEQLNDESFQELSQSLLLKVFPGLQCFPVGQRDGGRDAIVRLVEAAPDSSEFILFQVKFARRELNPHEARDWLLRTLRNELPKVENQIEEGAKRFVLITNVPGTSHPGAGSIDQLDALLKEWIPIPAQAWWREDLDRRLDDAWDIKFAYPALFSGTDLLRLVLESTPSEGRDRRHNAITAFLTTQFETDREVKFKQADIENDIFDLFTDVPLVPRSPAERRQGAVERLADAFHRAASSASGQVDQRSVMRWFEMASHGETSPVVYMLSDDSWLGAASLLLDADFQQAEPLVILEGAPGQGKSTIAQYICQIHRMRILNLPQKSALDDVHVNSSLRLPFKLELRDFATWLSGGNPFGIANDLETANASPRSLEGFLAALVRNGSGGAEFSVSDLQATLHSSSALIVLDGLDEVASTKQRQRVVEEITAAVSRLNGIAASLQVVVTSRPTPFTNSPVLPRRTFSTYALESLTRPLITKYAERWLLSRAIDDDAADEVREILNDKLDEPHLRDLARNPMQLAILLSLIHRRGVSLPDKRTALYDNYVDIFFDREAEKAAVVRENRDLLIRIHRYLAWELHAGAEVTPRSLSISESSATSLSGSISEHDLRLLLTDFLEKDGSDVTLVDKLFSGMVERVVAIVSRVHGTYEFDVQTLREYFAARHLYQTAPYSPAGDQRRGTISDRWAALSRNFYWLNVARFYAGCYSEGELASLVDELRVLSIDEVFRYTSHPQLLTATLLGDWVFSQRPRAIESAVDLLVEPRGLRVLVAGAASGFRHVERLSVRDPVGRRPLVSACKEFVGANQRIEHAIDLIWSVLLPNSEPGELFTWWIEELRSADESQASRWCLLGELMQCWSAVDLDTVTDLLGRPNVPTAGVINGLLHANRKDILESSEQLFDAAVEAVLAGERVGWMPDGSILQQLAASVERTSRSNLRSPYILTRGIYGNRDNVTGQDDAMNWPQYPGAERCARVVRVFGDAAERPVVEWETSIKLWDRLVQKGINELGDRTRFVELANIAAGIRSTEEKCEDSPNLFDIGRPLVRRARYARLRAGSRKWWSDQLQSANNDDEVWCALLIFSTWGGPTTIQELVEMFDNLVAHLEPSAWRTLHAAVRTAVEINSNRPWIRSLAIQVSALPVELNVRTVALLAERCSPTTADALYERYLTDYRGDDPVIISLRTTILIRRARADETKWPEAIENLRHAYSIGVPTNRVFFPHHAYGLTLPEAIARDVLDQPLDFPGVLIQAAEARCRQLDAVKILPVGRVAMDQGWFAD